MKITIYEYTQKQRWKSPICFRDTSTKSRLVVLITCVLIKTSVRLEDILLKLWITWDAKCYQELFAHALLHVPLIKHSYYSDNTNHKDILLLPDRKSRLLRTTNTVHLVWSCHTFQSSVPWTSKKLYIYIGIRFVLDHFIYENVIQ